MGEIATQDENNSNGQPRQNKRQKMRSVAIALALAFMVVLFYVATLVHLGANVVNRSF